jgi:acyl-CoA synthetase (NDP forming)
VPSPNLTRLLAPATVAVVGASERLGMSNNAVLPMLEAGIDVQLVNPNRDTVYDRPAAPSLTDLGTPVDAVLSLVSAERSVAVVEEAATLGCGGVVVAAGGFAEMGAEGEALQARLRAVAAAGDLAVVGPNCSGFMNVPRRVNLFTGGRIVLDPGGVAVVSQSGFLVRSALSAGRERRLGFSIAVSSGNEAVCDLADYIEALATDDHTRVICLVIEKVRDPERFFAAVAAARRAGKALLALKLGRTERSRDILRSHTGAIADESWVYDLVLGQLGVQTARDVDELLDMAQLLAQLPSEEWRPVRGVAVVASSGGVAGVAADAADEVGMVLPPLEELADWVAATIPGDGTRNPLDMTGFVMRDPALLEELFVRYGTAPSIDALVLCWWAAEGDEGWSRVLLEPLRKAAAKATVPIVVSPVEATAVGSWTAGFADLAFCRGLTSTYRALRAIDGAARWR